ncbi:MAG: hypothetical protein IJ906_07060 [Oscillospiraceae bacterium]|nr:hypothetical protein [Oscillospiraceae bacterium]
MNSSERELRRCRDHLASIGTGILMFGAWSVIKLNMELFVSKWDALETLPQEKRWIGVLILLVIDSFLSLTILAWNLFVGLSARSEGRKGRKHVLYLVLAAGMIVLYIPTLIGEIEDFSDRFDNLGMGIVTVYIDLTIIVTLIELEYAAIKSKILQKKLIKQG